MARNAAMISPQWALLINAAATDAEAPTSTPPGRMSLRRSSGTLFRNHCYIDGHTKVIAARADKTAPYRDRLADIAGDGNAYQIPAVDRPVRRVVSGPAGARKVDLGPCMRCPGPDGGGIAVVGK